MTCSSECTQFDLAMELLIGNGFEEIAEAAGLLMNTAMKTRFGEVTASLLEPRRRRLSVIATFRFSADSCGCQGCEERVPGGLGLDNLYCPCYPRAYLLKELKGSEF